MTDVPDLDLWPGGSPFALRSVGWAAFEPAPGVGPAMPAAALSALREAAVPLRSLKLGLQYCEFCDWTAVAGELHVFADDGRTYLAPGIAVHHAEDHGYRPPQEFVDALLRDRPLTWDARAEALVDVLLSDRPAGSARADAAMDLGYWADLRARDALWLATADEEMTDAYVGNGLGRSLAALWDLPDPLGPADYEQLPPTVQWGVIDGLERAGRLTGRSLVPPPAGYHV